MTIEHGHTTIVLFDSLQDLSSYRFHVYNLNMLIDSGIGADPEAVNRRLSMILGKIDKDPKGAKQEVKNLATTIQNIQNNISPELRCFCAFIRSVNGVAVTEEDLSESGIDHLVKMIQDKKLPMGKIWQALDFIKKKFRRSSRRSFLADQVKGQRRGYTAK